MEAMQQALDEHALARHPEQRQQMRMAIVVPEEVVRRKDRFVWELANGRMVRLPARVREHLHVVSVPSLFRCLELLLSTQPPEASDPTDGKLRVVHGRHGTLTDCRISKPESICVIISPRHAIC